MGHLVKTYLQRVGRNPLDNTLTSRLGKLMCKKGFHRWHEWVGNFATGWPVHGVQCFRCNTRKTWDELD